MPQESAETQGAAFRRRREEAPVNARLIATGVICACLALSAATEPKAKATDAKPKSKAKPKKK